MVTIKFLNHKTSFIILNATIAFLLSGAMAFYVLPINAYKIELVEEYSKSGNDILVYADLNDDGNSELLHFRKNDVGKPSLIVEESGKLWEQWNFKGEFIKDKFYFTGDYNDDTEQEIYVFTTNRDSIFLSVIATESYEWIFKNLFIDTFKYYNDIPDISIAFQNLTNLDTDSEKELLIVLKCGYSHVSRKLCSIDIDTKKVIYSPKAGSAVHRDFTLMDINDDGLPEMFGELLSTGNCPEDYPYGDLYSWLQIYSYELDFLFPPIKIGKYPGRNTSLPFFPGDQKLIANYCLHIGKDATATLALYSPGGEMIKETNIPYEEKMLHSFLITYPEQTRENMGIVFSDGSIWQYDENLNIINKSEQHTGRFLGRGQVLDIDGDGRKERIFIDNKKRKLVISEYDISFISNVDFSPSVNPAYFSVIEKASYSRALFIDHGQAAYTFSYGKNIFYTFRYLLVAGIFLVFFAFVSVLGWLQRRMVVRSFKARKQIASLQLKVIRNQMNPHFMMNILNSIGSLYGSNRIEEAESALGKYAKLLRSTLMSSDQIQESLKSELSFVTSYLELEKIRLNHHLDFCVEVADDVDKSVCIPKMLIHTFVENAIKHGIRPIINDNRGNIAIAVRMQDKKLHIEISDNGVGYRSLGETKDFSSGKGLSLLDDMIQLFKKYEDKHIEYWVTTKNANSRYPGTRVDVYMAINRNKWKRQLAIS